MAGTRRLRLAIVYLLTVITMAAFARIADAQTRIPEFTGDRLYVSGVNNVYQSVVDEITKLEVDSA